MPADPTSPPPEREEASDLPRLAVAGIVAGLLAGGLGAAFRWCLVQAYLLRNELVATAHRLPGWGFLVPVAASALAVALARFLVRFAPVASGSGVQHVEAVARGESRPARLRTLPVKFVGGLLALGSGMALGREGPTVQMGAVVGEEVGRGLRMRPDDKVDLLVASAGAGLAVAFNAPVGGSMFVIEEVAKAARFRLLLLTLLTAGVAVGISRVILGDAPMFLVPPMAEPSFASLAAFLAFGVVAGLLGAAYNRSVIAGLDLFAWSRAVPLEVRAAIAGGVVGLVAFWVPSMVGGGDVLNERLLAGAAMPVATLGLLLAVRWGLGVGSYSVGTPGGLFAPLLLVGATLGAIFQSALAAWLPFPVPPAAAFAGVGMAAFFAAVVRAPFTGLILVVEMTASTTLVIPMLVACFGAAATAAWTGSEPVYDTLRRRMLAADRAKGEASSVSPPAR